MVRFIHLDPEIAFSWILATSWMKSHRRMCAGSRPEHFSTVYFAGGRRRFDFPREVGRMAGDWRVGVFIPIEVFELVHHHELVKRGELVHPGFYWKVGVIPGPEHPDRLYLFQNRARLFRHH